MPRWDLFAGVVVLVTAAFLGLAHATSSTFSPDPSGTSSRTIDRVDSPTHPEMDSGTLVLNAALSQVLVGLPLFGIAWIAGVPADALGLAGSPIEAVVPGVAVGVAIYAANEAGAVAVERLGFDADERLRALLAPDSSGEWVLLLGVALPLIAGVEEFLFRAALIGGLAAAYDLPIWGLAVLSSFLFAVGHGLQGPGGILVTGVLGYGLAAAFVLTGSLWVVIVAHYLVNALEFLVHEGLGVEFGSA